MGFGLANARARGQLVARMAETMLRSMGGGSVQLQVPGAAAPSSGAELGLAPRPLQAIEFSPVTARALTSEANGLRHFELVFAAAQVNAEAQRNGLYSGIALIEAATAIVVQGSTMTIEKISTDSLGETPYLYRVIVQES
jgi:hypothetical protein